MITIKNVELKSTTDELTVQEFEQIMVNLNNHKLTKLDRWLNIIVICGMTDADLLASLKLSELQQFIMQLELSEITSPKDLVKKIELNNRTYVALQDDEDFTEPLAKDASLIQGRIEKKGFEYILYTMAILFKDNQLTFKEHYDKAHIQHKMSLFSQLPASTIISYLPLLTKNMINENENKKALDKLNKIMDEYDQVNTAE